MIFIRFNNFAIVKWIVLLAITPVASPAPFISVLHLFMMNLSAFWQYFYLFIISCSPLEAMIL